MACIESKDNRGTLRKEIWSFLQKEFGKSVDYRDFLLAMQNLEGKGKLTNTNGFFKVHDSICSEMMKHATPQTVISNRNTVHQTPEKRAVMPAQTQRADSTPRR